MHIAEINKTRMGNDENRSMIVMTRFVVRLVLSCQLRYFVRFNMYCSTLSFGESKRKQNYCGVVVVDAQTCR